MKKDKKKTFSFEVSDHQFKKASFSRIITFCVAVARTPEGVAVRDTKDPKKTTLFFKKGEWNAFIKGVKANEFDV